MAFHVVVCVKAVMVEAPMGSQGRSEGSMVMNPYDGAALETALHLREEKGGTVTAVTMGPKASAFVLHEARAMGVDRTVLLSDPALAGSDTLATSNALAAGLKKLMPFDLVLFGTRTADSDTGQIGPQVAVALNLPLITWTRNISLEDGGAIVESRVDGFVEKYKIILPAALTVDPRMVQARDLPLAGIHGAFDDALVETWGLGALGLAAAEVGLAGSPTVVVSMKRTKRKRTCQFVSGSAQEQVEKLVVSLSEAGLVK